jgi:arylsulfatase A-like enzyme
VRFALTAATLTLAAAGPLPTEAAPERPNVLLILGDDHAAYAMGCAGSREVRTPNLDALARSGALFSHAYCNSPVCTPSRQSLLTGRLPHAVGVTLLSTPLPERELTLAEHLRDASYETAAIGKMHFNNTLTHGFDRRIDAPEHRQHLQALAPSTLPSRLEVQGPWRPFADPADVWLNSRCLPYAARDTEMDASFFAAEAAAFMQRRREKPFFLVTSFTQPHSPFRFPVEYAGRVDPYRMPVPTVGPEDQSQIPLIFRGLTVPQKQGIAAAYCTSVEYLDAKVGQVLAALKASGQEKNTLVVYAGDHGYMLGHHGRFEKHCFYEEAVRSPLLARWPGRIKPGRRIGDLVEFVDLFPTISQACGAALPSDRHGQSLLPLLLGKTRRHRNAVVSQYPENEEAMIRTSRWKLIYGTGRRARSDGYITDAPTPGRSVRLYDLKKDPREQRNVAARRGLAAAVRDLKQRLLSRLRATAPADLAAPGGLSLDEQLDWYMVPPEVRRQGRVKNEVGASQADDSAPPFSGGRGWSDTAPGSRRAVGRMTAKFR